MSAFSDDDARLGAMHGYAPVTRRPEVHCPCGAWHARTGVTLGGVEVIACPNAAYHTVNGGYYLPGPVETREAPDA
jgi:hypothetical protein